MKKVTPSESVANQMSKIAIAIDVLTSIANQMTNDIDPDTESWADVGKYAHVSSAIDDLFERIGVDQ